MLCQKWHFHDQDIWDSGEESRGGDLGPQLVSILLSRCEDILLHSPGDIQSRRHKNTRNWTKAKILDVRMSSTRMTSGTWPAGWAVWWASSSAGASWASCSWCTACWRTCSCSAATGSNADHLFIYSSIHYLLMYLSTIHTDLCIVKTCWFKNINI